MVPSCDPPRLHASVEARQATALAARLACWMLCQPGAPRKFTFVPTMQASTVGVPTHFAAGIRGNAPQKAAVLLVNLADNGSLRGLVRARALRYPVGPWVGVAQDLGDMIAQRSNHQGDNG